LNEDKLGPKTIAGILRIDERVARARLSELWKEGVVERDGEGRYLFKPSKMSSLLEGWGL
jgi:predicted ArsR family transcriptional regulator